MGGKQSKPKGTRKTDANKEQRTLRRRQDRAAAVAARKVSKPQPKPNYGREARRWSKFYKERTAV
jgi:hypothetical protein